MKTHGIRGLGPLYPWPLTLAPYALLALAFGLRTAGLSELQVSGDAAWSVFLALKDLPALTLATAIDSHPPLYYYLLHAWMAAAGVSELSVRFLSAATGLLTVAGTIKLGQRLLGPAGGLVAGLLAAVSPFLVYFDRMPRMYSLLALLASLCLYLVVRLLGSGGGSPHPNPLPKGEGMAASSRWESAGGVCPHPNPLPEGEGMTPSPRWERAGVRELSAPLNVLARPQATLALYLLAALAALYTHYYGLLIVAAGFLGLAVGWRKQPGRLLALAGGHALIAVLFLPWLLYVLGPSVAVTTQAYGAIDLARPPSVLAFLERFWIALNVGDMLETGESRLLALALSLIWAAGIPVVLLRRNQQGDEPPDIQGNKLGGMLLLVFAGFVALPVAANALVYQLTPYVPFSRFLLFATPAYLLLLVWMLGELWRASRPAGGLAAALALGVTVYALGGTYYIEARAADVEAVEVARRVGPVGGADDGVIFQALWHAGYFRVRSGEKAPAPYALAEVPVAELPGLLERHPRLWLSMYSSARRDPLYPQEEWLDRNAYKAEELWQGNLRLALYGGRPDPALEPLGADYGGLVRLEAAGVGPRQVRGGDILRVYLRWRALEDPGQKYVAFVHLLNEGGRGCTGRDGEPVNSLRPTEAWKAGEVVDDRRGLLVGPGIPPGRYNLALGLYRREDWTQRLPISGSGGDRVLLGPIEVLPGPPLTQGDPVASVAVSGLELLDYQIERRWESRVVRNVDGPVEAWSPAEIRPGGRLAVNLRWRSARPPDQAYRLRLEMVDGSGRAWGLAPEGPLGGDCPTFRWAPGEVVSQTGDIAIQPDAPPGRYRLRASLYPQQGDRPLADPVVFGSLDLLGK